MFGIRTPVRAATRSEANTNKLSLSRHHVIEDYR
jgi:hypothetical protein